MVLPCVCDCILPSILTNMSIIVSCFTLAVLTRHESIWSCLQFSWQHSLEMFYVYLTCLVDLQYWSSPGKLQPSFIIWNNMYCMCFSVHLFWLTKASHCHLSPGQNPQAFQKTRRRFTASKDFAPQWNQNGKQNKNSILLGVAMSSRDFKRLKTNHG